MKFNIKSKLKKYNLEFIESYKKKILCYDKINSSLLIEMYLVFFLKIELKLKT